MNVIEEGTSMQTPVRIFCSYSHEDEKLLEQLKRHLAPLKNQGIIEEWHDRKIGAGEKWQSAIDQNLECADIIILLVSASFFYSKYCYWKEMKRALERHDAGEVRVIPVIVRSCIWRETPLSKLNALPKDGKAVTIWDDRDLAWTNVVEGIRRVIDTQGLQHFYRWLCTEGRNALLSQDVDIAPFLDDLTQDKRLGLTLVVRPSTEVATQLIAINDQLKQFAPRHFYYGRERFHFTIISLITAADPPQVTRDSAKLYERTIKEVLRDFPAFDVEFSGVCATRNSIIARGFPTDDTLDRLRDALRERLTAVGRGRCLDDRYRIQGAHVTLARIKVVEDFSPLLRLLDQLRNTPLGHMRVQRVQLVLNDFYMSANKAHLLAEFPLGDAYRPPTLSPLPKPDITPQAPKLHNLNIKQYPRNVVGRGDEHEYILRALSEADKPVIIASGFGGIGKSTLAMIVALSCVEQQGMFDFISWVDTRKYDESQTISLNYILDEIAKTADINSDIPSISRIDAKEYRVKELLKSHRSLLVLDNYESLLDDHKEEQMVSAFLESLPIGSMKNTCIRVLITTREVSAGLKALPIDDVRLQELSLEDSVELMKSRTPKHLRLTDNQYRWVWEMLCGLPKYMEIAIDQLKSTAFEDWEKIITDIEMPLDEGEKFFRDLFKHSWKRFSDDFKKILLSTTYFVGEASPEALQKTSGLPARQFRNVLVNASDAYIESTGTGYTVHPLTHAYCRAVLDTNSDFAEFREHAGFRFVEYYSEFTETAHKAGKADLLEREIRNIVAAARLAYKLQVWHHLIELQQHIAGFMRIRGYWQEQTEITRLAATACRKLGEEEMLAQCLVYDLGWLFLRFEDMEKAEDYINEGLEVFQKLDHREGIAQATRHLGKSALLKGLDPWYKPTESSKQHFYEAERLYTESLRIREVLEQGGLDQRNKIADMKLDFGRLYWLQGQKYERDGREQQDHELIKASLEKYEQANKVSREAMVIFEEICSDRGIAKAWGNFGNATKEIVRFLLSEGQLVNAIPRIVETHEYYEKSLDVAKRIKRKDEIAHALWGLAEVHELFADHPNLHSGFGNRKELLAKALTYAKESHGIYTSLGGSKDINTTQRLVDRINDKLSSL